MVYAVANERSRLEIPEGPLGKLISGNSICGYRQTEIVLIFLLTLHEPQNACFACDNWL